METLPNGVSADNSVEERRLEQHAALLSVRRLAEKLSNQLNFDRLRYASGAPFQGAVQPGFPKHHHSSSRHDPSPPSTPSPLQHTVHHYRDADSASGGSPPAVPLAPPRPRPPPPAFPPPPPLHPILRPPPNRVPAIYATVYSPPSSPSSSPSPPSVLNHYPHSLSSSSCPSLKSLTHPSASASPPALGLPSHRRLCSEPSLESLFLDDEAEQKRTPDAVLDTGEGSLVAGQDFKYPKITGATSGVCSVEHEGGQDAEQSIQSSGGESRDFIMDRFLPAARAVVVGDAPNDSSDCFAVDPCASVARERQSSPLIEPNIADELDGNVGKSSESRPNATAGHPTSTKTTGSRAHKARSDQRDHIAGKGVLFKSCGFLCLGLKTGVVHGCRRAVSSARSVSVPKNKAVDRPGFVDGVRESEGKTMPSQSVDFCESESTPLPARSVDVVQQANLNGSEEEDVREAKETLLNRHDQRVEPTPASSLLTKSPSPKHSSFSGSFPKCETNFKVSSQKYNTSSKGSAAHEEASTSLLAGHLHCQADSKDSSPKYGTSTRGSPLHEHVGICHMASRLHSQACSEDSTSKHGTSPVDEQASTRLVADGVNSQADSEESSPKYVTSSRGSTVQEEASIPLVVSRLHSQADSKDSSPKHSKSSIGSPLHEASTSFVASPLHSQDDSEFDEPTQFYDAPSRFSSLTNTPIHATYEHGTPMSFLNEFLGLSDWAEDWRNDATVSADRIVSHFDTTYTSDSDDKSQQSVSSHSSEGWFSPESPEPKSSRLSQRVGKVLRVDTGGNQPLLQEMNGFRSRTSGQGVPGNHSFLTELEQVLELRSGRLSRQVTPCSTSSTRHKSSAKPGLVSPILSAKCQIRGEGNGITERKPPDGMGWPLGISRIYTDSTLNSSRSGHKSNAQCIQGADVPVPPLPPAPSGSWLTKAVSSKLTKSSPSAASYRAGSTKGKLQCSSTEAARMRWESMVKNSHAQPGHLRFSEELLHHRPS